MNVRTTIAGIALVGAAGLGIGACGGSSGGSSDTTQWFNDTADRLVVEVSGPGPAQDQTNLIMPSGQTMSPQSAAPDTGANAALCTVTFSGGITWKVFSTAPSADSSYPANAECDTIAAQPGAVTDWVSP
jgi:hypothetical protein